MVSKVNEGMVYGEEDTLVNFLEDEIENTSLDVGDVMSNIK